MAANRWAAFENTALCVYCPSVLGSHWALEITARTDFEATLCSKVITARAWPLSARIRCSTRPFSYSTALENITLAQFVRTLRSTSLLGRARQPLGEARLGRASLPCGARNRCSWTLHGIRPRFRFSFEIPFWIGMLRVANCFELCFARLRRHCSVLHANQVLVITLSA